MKLITLITSSFVLILSGCQIADTLGIGSANKEAPAAAEGNATAPAAEEKAATPEKKAPAPKK
jgi:hypothetical protein